MNKEAENYKKELRVKDYCDKYKISEQQLFEKLNISSYGELQNWAYVLMELSTVKYHKDFLTKFMNNKRYLELKKRKFSNTELGSKLPDELRNFFSVYGATCPDCGGLIVEHNDIHLDGYKCINCDKTRGSLEEILDKINGIDRSKEERQRIKEKRKRLKEERQKNKWFDKYLKRAVITEK